jgi:SpoVK/Ycf46/Vps4 family AAA+-type ATPase
MGVPGCGKSLAAKAISSKWQMPLYLLDFATVQGRYVGQSEQQLREALEAAEYVSPCVLWIDEIEKGLSGATSDNGITNRMIGQFLFWLQECKKEVFVVATANNVDKLPAELLRKGRFDEIFFVDLPNEIEREEIIRLYVNKYLKVNINDSFIAKLVELSNGFAGADIEAAIRDITYKVVADEIQLTQELFVDVFSNAISLSKTNPGQVEKIRMWGKEHALSATKK